MQKVYKTDNLYTSLFLSIYTVIYITKIYNTYINLNIFTSILMNNLYTGRLYDRCFHM